MGDNAPVAFMNVTTDDVINHIDKYGDRAFNYVIVKEHKSVDGVVERVDLAGSGTLLTITFRKHSGVKSPLRILRHGVPKSSSRV